VLPAIAAATQTRHNSSMDPASTPHALAPPPDAERLENARGWLAFWELGPHAYMSAAHGFMTRDMAQLLIRRVEPKYTSGAHIHGVHNWFDMEGYETASRTDLTAWVLRHREQTSLHIGLRSRIVAMGVAVANLALGNLIHVYNDPKRLEEALLSLRRSL
jgi:cation diffusion facilitator CzcD-associated flavoprotein CzcO